MEAKEKIHKCNICAKKFSKRVSLSRHLKQHSRVPWNPWQCRKCSKCFPSRRKLKVHSSMHGTAINHTCHVCRIVFAEKHLLKAHTQAEHKANLSCSTCGSIFSNKSSLRKHFRVHTEATKPDQKFPCSICNKAYSTRHSLQDHAKLHALETSSSAYECEICPKKFTYASLLARHLASHDYGQQLSCSDCDKKFNNQIALNQHARRNHIGQSKGFSCAVCDKTFPFKCYLQRHMKAHTSKEFTCDICKRAFSQKENLKRHMNIHADVEKYKCERCSESFSSWSEVRVHVLREHAENPHPCALCDSIFANRWNLSRHMASAHGPSDTTSVNDDEENSMSVCENANSITVGSNNNPEFILGIESNLYVHDEETVDDPEPIADEAESEKVDQQASSEAIAAAFHSLRHKVLDNLVPNILGSPELFRAPLKYWKRTKRSNKLT